MYLTGMAQREVYGAGYRVKDDITIDDLFARTHHVIDREIEVVRDQLMRNHVDISAAAARSSTRTRSPSLGDDASAPRRRSPRGTSSSPPGSTPNRPEAVPFDERTVLDSDGILAARADPELDGRRRRRGHRHRVRVDVRGARHARHRHRQAARAARVVRRRDRRGAQVPPARPGGVVPVRRGGGRRRQRRRTAPSRELASGKRIAGRGGAVLRRPPGRRPTRSTWRTPGCRADRAAASRSTTSTAPSVPHIFAVGDVIGFPALAATSMEQGRLAACHAFGEPARELQTVLPIGIYTIPEISYCGRTEEELTDGGGPLRGRHRALPRARARADRRRPLRDAQAARPHRDARAARRAHLRDRRDRAHPHRPGGDGAAAATIDYFVDTVFNYPTLAEAYKVAALDAMNKIRQVARFSL